MDEISLAMLQSHGYDYIHGGIVDAEGNYLPTLELRGKTFNSESDEDFFKSQIALDKEVQNKVSPKKEIENYPDGYFVKRNVKNEKALLSKNKYQKILTDKDYFKTEPVNSLLNYPIVLAVSLILFVIIKKLKG